MPSSSDRCLAVPPRPTHDGPSREKAALRAGARYRRYRCPERKLPSLELHSIAKERLRILKPSQPAGGLTVLPPPIMFALCGLSQDVAAPGALPPAPRRVSDLTLSGRRARPRSASSARVSPPHPPIAARSKGVPFGSAYHSDQPSLPIAGRFASSHPVRRRCRCASVPDAE